MYKDLLEQFSLHQLIVFLKQSYEHNYSYTNQLLFEIANNSDIKDLLLSEDEECNTLGGLTLLGDFYFELWKNIVLKI